MPFINKLKPAFYSRSLINILSILVFTNTAHAVMPDTGQTKCFNNTVEIPCPSPGQPFYGQDGNYLGPQQAYQISSDGLVVTDLNTGLMWQQAGSGRFGWVSAISYCENLTLGGFSDWRLPSHQELISVVDYGRNNPAINTVFTGQGGPYSSGTAAIDEPDSAWCVDFYYGSAGYCSKDYPVYARCVRGETSMRAYLDNGDGTVTETNTGLVWQQTDDHLFRTWENALSYCETLNLAGQTDWRLPNIKELQSIVDEGRYRPAINPNFKLLNSDYWSGSTTVTSPDAAWAVNFYEGHAFYWEPKSNIKYVCCIRGSASGQLGSLDIAVPDGGESLVKGQNYTIRWNGQNVTGTIQIDLYKGGRTSQQFLRQIAAAAPNTGIYLFTPPNDVPNGNDYLIRISANSGSVQDFSRAFFTITDTPPNTNRSAPWNLLLLLNE